MAAEPALSAKRISPTFFFFFSPLVSRKLLREPGVKKLSDEIERSAPKAVVICMSGASMNGESDRERGSRLPASPVAGRPPLLPFHKRPKGQKWAGTRQHRGISLLPTAQPASSSPWAPYPRSSGGEGEGHDSGGQTWRPFTLEAPVGEVSTARPPPPRPRTT